MVNETIFGELEKILLVSKTVNNFQADTSYLTKDVRIQINSRLLDNLCLVSSFMWAKQLHVIYQFCDVSYFLRFILHLIVIFDNGEDKETHCARGFFSIIIKDIAR